MRGRKDHHLGEVAHLFTGDRIDHDQLFDRVAEHLDTQDLLFIRGMDLDRVASDAKTAANDVHVIAVVLEINQLAQNRPLVVVDTGMQFEEMAAVLFGRAHSVDAAH